jgi:hypothetical protein
MKRDYELAETVPGMIGKVVHTREIELASD